MGFFKKLFGDAADELKKNFEDAKKEMRNNLEEMKRNTMAGFTNSASNSRDDDEEDEEPKILLGNFQNGVLTIREGITELDDESLEHYKRIRKIVFPASLDSLDSNVIDEQEQLEELDFSKVTKLKTIPDDFVSGDNNIRKFIIPDGVTEVGYGFLGNVKPGAEIYVPASVRKLGYITGDSENGIIVYLFAANIDISDVEEDVKTLYVLPDDYAHYAKKLKDCDSEVRLREMPEDKITVYERKVVNAKKQQVPPPPKPVAPVVFTGRDCAKDIAKIIIPEGVTEIGDEAFYRCSGLTSVTIPNSVTSIGDGAFRDCSGLTSVTIPNSVTSIGDDAFSGCSGLTSVTIGNSVTSIGYHAFFNCDGLTSVTIPDSVTSIGDDAFCGCSGLTSVTIGNSVTSIGDDAFCGCSGLTSVTIGNSVTSIGHRAFYGCSGLTSVTIPNSVTKIGDEVFHKNENLTSLVLADSITEIGRGAFDCPKLTVITFPKELRKLDKMNAKYHSSCFKKLRKLDFSKVTKLKVIPEDFLFEAPKVKELVLPIGVTKIEECIGCVCLRRLFLPPTIEEVEDLHQINLDIYCFAPKLEELGMMIESIEDPDGACHLFVLPEYFDAYKAQRDAEGISETILTIDVIPEEFRYYYDS